MPRPVSKAGVKLKNKTKPALKDPQAIPAIETGANSRHGSLYITRLGS
jgi:hypothetical protein